MGYIELNLVPEAGASALTDMINQSTASGISDAQALKDGEFGGFYTFAIAIALVVAIVGLIFGGIKMLRSFGH